MKLPGKIKIGQMEYSILCMDGDISWGKHTYAKARICIDDELDDEAVPSALWHEVFHAILHQAGYNKSTLDDGQYDFLDQIIIAIPFGIVQVLRDNPALREL